MSVVMKFLSRIIFLSCLSVYVWGFLVWHSAPAAMMVLFAALFSLHTGAGAIYFLLQAARVESRRLRDVHFWIDWVILLRTCAMLGTSVDVQKDVYWWHNIVFPGIVGRSQENQISSWSLCRERGWFLPWNFMGKCFSPFIFSLSLPLSLSPLSLTHTHTHTHLLSLFLFPFTYFLLLTIMFRFSSLSVPDMLPSNLFGTWSNGLWVL